MPRNTTTTVTSRRATGRSVVSTAPVPFDRASDPDAAAYDALSADLAAAGRRARNRKAQLTNSRPDPAYSDALRGRLVQPAGPGASLAAVVGAPAGAPSFERAHQPQAARRTAPRRLLAVLAIGGLVLALVAAGLASGRVAGLPSNRVGEALNASLVRAGSSQALLAGSALMVGDEIRVAPDGHATLDLGSSQTRLAGGADLRIDVLSSSNVQLALLAGRAYHRVVVPAGGSYAVVTGPDTWTATGTAFDLDRMPAPTGGEQVTLLALEHPVVLDGPDAHEQVPEGDSATVLLGNPASTGATIGPIPTIDFSDPWLINNARIDEALGYPIGALAGVGLAPNGTPMASPSQSLTPTEGPTDSPSLEPSPSDSPTGGPSPTPGLTTSPPPSASPSPTPTATPLPTFGLNLTSCPGGVVMSWSKYSGSGFARYVTLRSTTNPNMPRAYPQAGATTVATTTNRNWTTGGDGGVNDGLTYFYRTFALDSANHILAASSTENAIGLAQATLPSPVSVSASKGIVSWGTYSDTACFSEYRLLYSTSSAPTVANSSWVTVSPWSQTYTPIPSAGWIHGQTFYFRIQVVRVTLAGSFVVGQTGVSPPFTY